MLMLPCVLGEFRTMERGDEAAKQIIGLPAARQRMVATDGPAARALGIWGFSGGNSVKV